MRIGNLIKRKDNSDSGLYLIVDNISYHEAGGRLPEEYPSIRYWKLINPNGIEELLLNSCESSFEVVE